MSLPRANSREAFARLYEEYMPRVYRFISYKVSNTHVAEDLTSAVFEKALVNFEKYDSTKAGFSTWVFAIARNTVIDHFRTRAKHQMISLDDVVDVPSGKELPAETVEKEEQAKVLRQCLTCLPKDDQEIVQLKFAGELTNREIAGMLGMTESNVGVRLFRAIRKLRDSFQEAWDGGSR